jgi:hypothetical protein
MHIKKVHSLFISSWYEAGKKRCYSSLHVMYNPYPSKLFAFYKSEKIDTNGGEYIIIFTIKNFMLGVMSILSMHLLIDSTHD